MTTMTTLEKTAYDWLKLEYDSVVEDEASASGMLEDLGHFALPYDRERDFFSLPEAHRRWIVESNAAVHRQAELVSVLRHFPDFRDELEWLSRIGRHPESQGG